MVARDYNHESIIYNRDALKNEGLEDPKEDWTWNDFKDYCKRLTKTIINTTAKTAKTIYNNGNLHYNENALLGDELLTAKYNIGGIRFGDD